MQATKTTIIEQKDELSTLQPECVCKCICLPDYLFFIEKCSLNDEPGDGDGDGAASTICPEDRSKFLVSLQKSSFH